MKCPVCQSEAPGAYCPACGAPVDGARCKSCEAPLLGGANFCTRCGEPVRPAASRLPWYVAGGAVVALIVALLAPGLRSGRAAPGFGGAAGPIPAEAGAFDAGRAPPLTGSPREQADRLFNRVMQAQAQGDTAQVSFFLPMAVLAYRQAGDLDHDGLYHLSVLETASGDPASGRATAERILRDAPDHLLALAVAAQAAAALGDDAGARGYYERLLAAFETEAEKPVPEYSDHAQILPVYRSEARAFLGR